MCKQMVKQLLNFLIPTKFQNKIFIDNDKNYVDNQYNQFCIEWKKNNKNIEKKQNDNLNLLYQNIIDIEKEKKNILFNIDLYQKNKNNKKINIDNLDNELKFISFHLNYLKNNWIKEYKQSLILD